MLLCHRESTSASFLAEISVKSPWIFLIFIIYTNIFCIKVSKKYIFKFWERKHRPAVNTSHVELCLQPFRTQYVNLPFRRVWNGQVHITRFYRKNSCCVYLYRVFFRVTSVSRGIHLIQICRVLASRLWRYADCGWTGAGGTEASGTWTNCWTQRRGFTLQNGSPASSWKHSCRYRIFVVARIVTHTRW